MNFTKNLFLFILMVGVCLLAATLIISTLSNNPYSLASNDKYIVLGALFFLVGLVGLSIPSKIDPKNPLEAKKILMQLHSAARMNASSVLLAYDIEIGNGKMLTQFGEETFIIHEISQKNYQSTIDLFDNFLIDKNANIIKKGMLPPGVDAIETQKSDHDGFPSLSFDFYYSDFPVEEEEWVFEDSWGQDETE